MTGTLIERLSKASGGMDVQEEIAKLASDSSLLASFMIVQRDLIVGTGWQSARECVETLMRVLQNKNIIAHVDAVNNDTIFYDADGVVYMVQVIPELKFNKLGAIDSIVKTIQKFDKASVSELTTIFRIMIATSKFIVSNNLQIERQFASIDKLLNMGHNADVYAIAVNPDVIHNGFIDHDDFMSVMNNLDSIRSICYMDEHNIYTIVYPEGAAAFTLIMNYINMTVSKYDSIFDMVDGIVCTEHVTKLLIDKNFVVECQRKETPTVIAVDKNDIHELMIRIYSVKDTKKLKNDMNRVMNSPETHTLFDQLLLKAEDDMPNITNITSADPSEYKVYTNAGLIYILYKGYRVQLSIEMINGYAQLTFNNSHDNIEEYILLDNDVKIVITAMVIKKLLEGGV